MTKHEKARATARTEMEANWAKSIGNCGLCPKAAKGQCNAVLAMAKAVGFDENQAKDSISARIEDERAKNF